MNVYIYIYIHTHTYMYTRAHIHKRKFMYIYAQANFIDSTKLQRVSPNPLKLCFYTGKSTANRGLKVQNLMPNYRDKTPRKLSDVPRNSTVVSSYQRAPDLILF